MSTLTITNSFTAGTVIKSSEMNTNFTDLTTWANGNVDNSNIPTNGINGTKLALTSEVQGAIMYHNGTDWVVLGPGTSGQFLKTNGASANPAWAASGASYKVVQASRTAAAGSGNQALTGAGFAPKGALFFAVVNAAAQASWGPASSTGGTVAGIIYVRGTAGTNYTYETNTTVLDLDDLAGNSMVATLSSWDADGATVAWTKAGLGVNVNYSVLFFG